MRVSWAPRLAVAAVAAILAGCAGSGGPSGSALERAERACGRAADVTGDVAACDSYVALAEQTGDYQDRHSAYSSRSIFYEMRGDLDAAIADADRALVAWPTSSYGQGWRAALMLESGEYEAALAKFEALRTINDQPLWYAEMATLEYVVDDRAQAAELFRNAEALLDADTHDLPREAYFKFNAAIIESELRNGDLAPIRALAAEARINAMVDALRKHRLGEMSDAELSAIGTQAVARLGEGADCIIDFAIGHRHAVSGQRDTARAAFLRAAGTCKTRHFEYHATKAWLKQLGA